MSTPNALDAPRPESCWPTPLAKGKGLLMLGGIASFGRGHYRGTQIADALPIEIDRLEGADFQEPALDQFFLPAR